MSGERSATDGLDCVEPGDDPLLAWHDGRCPTPDLARRIGDDLVDIPVDGLGDWSEPGDEPIDVRRELTRAWGSWTRQLDRVGFEAEDYAKLLDSVTPRLTEARLRSAPPTSTSPSVSERTPKARIYLDIDGAFSPYCPQEQQRRDLPYMTGTAIDQAPETGWTWKMTTLGLGWTPLPVELAHHLAELDSEGMEVVWNSTWQHMADALLPAVGLDAAFRTHTWDIEAHSDPKWQLVVTDLHHDPVPFVWIDDRAIDPSTWAWAARQQVPNLLVHTNGYYGVTPATWSRVTDWLDAHGSLTMASSNPPFSVRSGRRSSASRDAPRPAASGSPLRSWPPTAALFALDPEPPSAKRASRDD